jgi:(E)-4-hydroxy-3-methylbut-2-enyl-diphosphate synthase
MSKKINIGGVYIGGGERVKIQSMSTFKISDTEKAVEECLRLKEAGVDIMRFSVLDEKDAAFFCAVKKRVGIPLVADIHFDYRLAIKAIDGGADKIRINPGNIGGESNVKAVADTERDLCRLALLRHFFKTELVQRGERDLGC